MRRLLLVACIGLLAGAAGLFVAGDRLLAYTAARALAMLQASLPPGASVAHDGMATSLWRREVVLTGVRIHYSTAGTVTRLPVEQLEAGSLTIQGVPWFDRHSLELGRVVLADVRGHGEYEVSAASLALESPGYGVPPKELSGGLLAGYRFAATQADRLSISQPAQGLTVTVGHLEMEGLKDGWLSVLRATQLHLGQKRDKGEDVLDAAQVEAAAVQPERLVTIIRNRDLFSLLAEPLVGQAHVSGVRMQEAGRDMAGMDRLDFSGQQDGNGVRTAVSLQLTGLDIRTDLLPVDSARYFRDMGYDRFTGRCNLTGRYDPLQRMLNLETIEVEIDNGFRLRSGFQFGDVVLPGVARPASMPFSGLAAASILGLQVELTELGMIRRHTGFEAKRLQVTPDVYVEQRIASWAPTSYESGAGAQRLGQMYRAIGTFLMDPHQLTITAQPPQPVSVFALLMTFARLDAVAESLNLKAVNRRP